MKHKNTLMLGVALLMATPTFSATTDDNGTRQTLTVNNEQIERTVSEIRLDGNNAVLLFSDSTTLTVDMRLVTLTMSYEETTGIDATINEKGTMINDEWYTVNGVKLTLKSRQDGIYIHNGKKIVNKKK